MGISSNSIEGGIGSDLSRMHVKRYQLFCRRLALSLLPPPPTSTSACCVRRRRLSNTPDAESTCIALLECPGLFTTILCKHFTE
jgi:hypothetical protein